MSNHEFLVAFSKSGGLFYLILVFLGAVIYALWPKNQEKFDRAANAILEEDPDE